MEKKNDFNEFLKLNPLKRVWLRLFKTSTKIGLGDAYFLFSFRVLNLVLDRRWIQNTFFSKHTQLISEFLKFTDIKSQTIREAVRCQIIERTLIKWRYLNTKNNYSPIELSKNFILENWKYYEQAATTGKGIIFVLSHFGIAQIFLKYMKSQGYDILALPYGLKPHSNNPVIPSDVSEKERVKLSSKNLSHAFESLQNGGLVYILPDGKFGKANVIVPFFGRERAVRSGFAKLAIMANAIVIPVTVKHNNWGKIILRFFQPLIHGDAKEEFGARESLLVKSYTEHLAQIWAESPGNIRLSTIAKFMKSADVYSE